MNKIKLSKEKQSDMIEQIKLYFKNERDEEIGELSASLLYDFFIEKIAPAFYNQGVYDSYCYMNERVEDLLEIQKN